VDLRGTDAAGRAVVVPCKRTGPDNTVGSSEVQRFTGAIVHHRAEQGRFIATPTYARQARELAESSPAPMEPNDGKRLVEWARAAS
jgi:restriction endonuclease Mrr